jgi:hypothetical protein
MSDDEKVKYVLELDVPGLDNKAEVEIPGLGVFQNGQTHEITEQQASDYRVRMATAEPVYDDDDIIIGSEVSQGPTVLQASRAMMEGISVSTANANDDQEEDEVETDTGMQMVEEPEDEDEDETAEGDEGDEN